MCNVKDLITKLFCEPVVCSREREGEKSLQRLVMEKTELDFGSFNVI